MSDIQHLPPIKRKRDVPLDPARQLAAGRPSPGREEGVWSALAHPSQDEVRRYGADRFELARYIRHVSVSLEKLARVRKWQRGLFSVSTDAFGNPYLDIRPLGVAVLELFSKASREKAAAAIRHYPDCDFHPNFSLFWDFLESKPFIEINGRPTYLADISDHYFYSSKDARRPLLNHPDIYRISDAINTLLTPLYQATRDALDNVKSFRRTAKNNRCSLMQYAYHLMDGEPNTMIAHLTIRRDTKIIGCDPPISREKSEYFRKRLVKHIKRQISNDDYLGHTILLKRDAILGCWFEAFVFFTKNALVQDADLMSKLVDRWNGEIGPSRAGCVGKMLFLAHDQPSKRYAETLDKITFVTEPDFYCRVSANNLHRFWCTHSPVGKLAERTKQNKRREANKMRAAATSNPFTDRVLESALLDEELRAGARWTNQRKRRNEKLSAKNRKAAKKRSPRTSTGVSAAPVRYATTTLAANEETYSDGQSTETGSATPQPAPGRPSPANRLGESKIHTRPDASAPTTPPRREISLERRPREDATSGSGSGSGSGRKYTVEVRKKRKLPPPKSPDLTDRAKTVAIDEANSPSPKRDTPTDPTLSSE
ncbi:hypothetical protein GO283_01610 [Ralstonia solanacearum]|nr:hypothetical protein [Ralstonia solanacearum]NKA93106.1 hypothetical protein [Ralstonia solanacearum]